MRVFLFLLSTLIAQVVLAKTVNVEWEETEGAKVYDLQWTKVPSPKNEMPFSVQVKAPQWSGHLAPGTYQMQVRARDHRLVPGEWSAPEEFKVGLDPVKGRLPANDEIRRTGQPEAAVVNFKWEAVPDAKSYSFQLSSEDGSREELHSVTDTELTLKLPVAQKYSWSVEAQSADGFVSEKAPSQSFTLIGGKLEAPLVDHAHSVGALKWAPSAHAETYDIAVFWLNPATGKWQPLDAVKDDKATEIPFKTEWIGGEYLVQMQAKASLREESDKIETRFRVRDLNRAPAAENTFVLKRQIERRRGLYALAQQQLTMVDYSSTDVDQSQNAHFSTLAGQGRVGLGSFGDGPWGILGTAEFGGLYIDNRTYNSSTFEITGIHRDTSDDGETRHYFGIFTKELPLLSSSNSISYRADRVSVYGPHYGYERNWVLGSRTGVQASLHGYFNLFKLHTPDGTDLSPSASVQLAILGSYRLTPTATGYYGYAFRSDSISYRSTVNNSDNNRIQVTGHYLNFYLEWAL